MGPGALLVPEQKVVLDSDPERARALARKVLVNTYFRLVNYTSMLRSIGFTDDDLAGEASDRLIDAVANHGDVRAVADEASGHLDAGADQVAIQLLTGRDEDPVPGFTALAEALIR
jgi:probable F420-dependent oxidoreductase